MFNFYFSSKQLAYFLKISFKNIHDNKNILIAVIAFFIQNVLKTLFFLSFPAAYI